MYLHLLKLYPQLGIVAFTLAPDVTIQARRATPSINEEKRSCNDAPTSAAPQRRPPLCSPLSAFSPPAQPPIRPRRPARDLRQRRRRHPHRLRLAGRGHPLLLRLQDRRREGRRGVRRLIHAVRTRQGRLRRTEAHRRRPRRQGYDGIAISAPRSDLDGRLDRRGILRRPRRHHLRCGCSTTDMRSVFVSQASDEELGPDGHGPDRDQAGGKGQYAIVSGRSGCRDLQLLVRRRPSIARIRVPRHGARGRHPPHRRQCRSPARRPRTC